ncbi:hypothetical protein XFF4834R_chr15760 [Xanthomonas citri pv. fuscans]|nr:hypothetical protein XFF4834R_chr15760 [Xanthomonas citri pv. fuscans]
MCLALARSVRGCALPVRKRRRCCRPNNVAHSSLRHCAARRAYRSAVQMPPRDHSDFAGQLGQLSMPSHDGSRTARHRCLT